MTFVNLQDACLKLVVLARARADGQTQRVVSFRNQMDARMEIIASMHIHVPMGSVYAVALSHIIFTLVPVLADNTAVFSNLDQTV